MALVNRWYHILEILVAQHSVSLETMRKELNVSMKTLLTSIEQFNAILDDDIQIRQENNHLLNKNYQYPCNTCKQSNA